MNIFIIDVFYIVTFVIAYPVILFFVLRRLKNTLLRDKEGRVMTKDVTFRSRRVHNLNGRCAKYTIPRPLCMLDTEYVNAVVGLLYEFFEIPYYYWQTYEIFRKLLSTGGVILVAIITQGMDPSGGGYEIYFAQFVAIASFAIHQTFLPFRHAKFNSLQTAILANHVITLQCVINFGSTAQEGFNTVPYGVGLIIITMQAILVFWIAYLIFLYKEAKDDEDERPQEVLTKQQYNEGATKKLRTTHSKVDEVRILIQCQRAALCRAQLTPFRIPHTKPRRLRKATRLAGTRHTPRAGVKLAFACVQWQQLKWRWRRRRRRRRIGEWKVRVPPLTVGIFTLCT